MRRWSRASDHSSINIKTEHDADDDDDLEDFVRLVGSNHELGLFQQQRSTSAQMLSSASDSTSSTGGGGAGSSIMLSASLSKKAALSHFQSLRETHNSLSDSLTSSMLIGNAGASTVGISGGGGGGGGGNASTSSQQHDPVTGISPVSSISSTGRSYQPIIPSPLHAEQRSTSPVHIPRSFPQLRSMTNPQNALRLARLNLAEESHRHIANEDEDEEDDENGDYNYSHRHSRRRRQRQRDTSAYSSYGSGNNDMSAFSTYPQDHHNQNLNFLRNTAATTGHTGGRAPGTPISYNRPILQDGGGGKETRNGLQQQQEQQQQRRQSLMNSDRYQLQKSQHNMDSSSDNSLMMMQDNANASSRPRANNSSLMDDDDSLVFKMSELECEGPPPPPSPAIPTASSPAKPTVSSPSPNKQHDIFRYNNSSSNITNAFGSSSNGSSVTATSPTNATNNRVNEHFLELTPTPLSPPLLHRLQNISMSTVTEEEERITNSGGLSVSGSSDKSDPNATTTTSNTVKPSHLQFDRW